MALFPAQSKLPRHPAPILRIGRLAVEFSQRVGLYAVVDTKHGKAKAFYTKLGFIACMDSPLSLYLPVATLEHSLVS